MSAERNGEEGYYGQPILKPPTWTNLIPTYFFTGGLAGVSAMLSFAARLHGDRDLERSLDVATAGAIGVSAFCLIADLGKPARFLNMLRVVKPTSPMSMGTYIFSVFSATSLSGFALDAAGIGGPAPVLFKGIAALFGPLLSTYTGVLIADTAVPAWHEARSSLPGLFAAGAAMSGAGAGLLFGPAEGSMCARVAFAAVAAELASLERVRGELGPKLYRAFEEGRAKPYARWARRLAVAGGVVLAAARGRTVARRAAGAMLLASALLERFAVVEAGRISAKDPSYVLAQQRPEQH